MSLFQTFKNLQDIDCHGHMSNGMSTIEQLWIRGALSEGSLLVDIGCGFGRLANITRLEPSLRYIGMEVSAKNIASCRQRFPEYTFHLFDGVNNPYYAPEGTLSASDVKFPIEDAVADAVTCSSLFTHFVYMADVENYLNEIHRILKPGGCVFTSWFRNPPNPPGATAQRRVFLESEIINLLSRWETLWSTCGTTTSHHDQWVILSRKEMQK